MTSALDSECELALVACTGACLTPRFDLATLGQEAAQFVGLLVVDVVNLVDAVGADLAAAKAASAASTPPATGAAEWRRSSLLGPAGATITWRSLFVLGLAGGLIPSTSALLILLGSIAAGRAGFGFVLVVAFGLGMALVMGGIGVALVLARGRVERMAPTSPLGRVSGYIPLAAAVLVFGLGLYLTAQAVGGAPVL